MNEEGLDEAMVEEMIEQYAQGQQKRRVIELTEYPRKEADLVGEGR